MSAISIPQAEFIPHPEGRHEGIIAGVDDKGIVDTQFGKKPKIVVTIESLTAFMSNGQPFTINKWFTVSSHPKSALREFRETMAGRKLTPEEIDSLNPQIEFIERRVGFTCIHNTGSEGGIFANINNIWPLDSEEVEEDSSKDSGSFPSTPEEAMGKVMALVKTNKNATADWLKKQIEAMDKSPFDLTVTEWQDLWVSVSQDIPI